MAEALSAGPFASQILCTSCRQPLAMTRGFGAQLRTAVCTNLSCRLYGLARETTLYTVQPGMP